MKRADALKIVEEMGPPMVVAAGMDHWFSCYQLKPMKECWAECRADARYERFTLKFDPDQLTDRESLEDSIRHELVHALHAPFEEVRTAYREIVSVSEYALLDQIYLTAAEHTRIRIETMLERLGFTPKKLAAAGRKILAKRNPPQKPTRRRRR